MTRPRKIRLMADGVAPVRKGLALATGDVGRPARRCEWRVVATFTDGQAAKADMAYRSMDPRKGRAVFDLTRNPCVVWIGRDGKIVQS